MGGDILIIDDPFKDRAEADSPTIRRKVWDWYTSTLYTRLAPGGGILLINTRWHMDDLSGRLLEAERRGEGDAWRVVNFPAIATEDEPHRKCGEALHPERYPLEQLEGIRRAVGAREWEALYQQHPTPDGGSIFRAEWLRFWYPKDLPLRFEKLVLSWDMTFKEGDDTDYVVGQAWGKSGADFYLLDQVRRRMGFTETLAAFRALADKWPGLANWWKTRPTARRSSTVCATMFPGLFPWSRTAARPPAPMPSPHSLKQGTSISLIPPIARGRQNTLRN